MTRRMALAPNKQKDEIADSASEKGLTYSKTELPIQILG